MVGIGKKYNIIEITEEPREVSGTVSAFFHNPMRRCQPKEMDANETFLGRAHSHTPLYPNGLVKMFGYSFR